MHNVREREYRKSESNANTKICFEVRAPSSTSTPSHRRISTNSSRLDFPHREPPLWIWVIQAWEYTTPLSNKYNFYTRGKAQHKSPLHLEGWALSQTQINLSLEGQGSKPTSNNHLYTYRDTSNSIVRHPLHLEGKAQSQSK